MKSDCGVMGLLDCMRLGAVLDPDANAAGATSITVQTSRI
jgi:hypothetical protein